jgi:hypothetical protein
VRHRRCGLHPLGLLALLTIRVLALRQALDRVDVATGARERRASVI